MPYALTWEPRGVVRRYMGDVTIDERRASFDAICGDWRFDDLRWVITDYLAVQRYEITPQATAEIAALHIAPLTTNPRIAIAAVVTRPDILEAIEDFKRTGMAPAPYRHFSTMAQARVWLDRIGSLVR